MGPKTAWSIPCGVHFFTHVLFEQTRVADGMVFPLARWAQSAYYSYMNFEPMLHSSAVPLDRDMPDAANGERFFGPVLWQCAAVLGRIVVCFSTLAAVGWCLFR